MMNIGIVGTTPKATAIARALTGRGTRVTLSDPGDHARAARLAREIGPSAVADIPYNQSVTSDVLILALPWADLDVALARLGPLGHKIVVDAMLPERESPTSGARMLARKLDTRRVVEAFIDPPTPGRSVEVCADDPEAKAVVTEIILACGMRPHDAGTLAHARELEEQARAA